MDDITLLIFTCEGKEHLLPDTYKSFKLSCNCQFKKTILAIDGPINKAVIENVNADVIVQNFKRKGYIYSIVNAISLVDTKYYFWLEDDFKFEQPVPLTHMRSAMEKFPNWAGVFLSRTAPLTSEEKNIHFFENFYRPHFGFSVSPTLCKTPLIREAFEAMKNLPKNENTKTFGFETFISDYFLSNNLDFALLDPGSVAHVTHVGKLESTARQYHMINSLEPALSSVDKEYISGFGYNKKISFITKSGMVFKLWISILFLSLKIFSDRQAYDYAFRIYQSYLKKFRH